MARYRWQIANALSSSPTHVELIFSKIPTVREGDEVTLDLDNVTWVRPYGAVALFEVCRYLTAKTGLPIRIEGMQAAVHAYLDRIDFFGTGTICATTTLDPGYALGRNPASTNLLELVPLQSQLDVYEVIEHARRIVATWLCITDDDTDRIVSLLSEACANVVDHSQDEGVVTIQKYEYRDAVDVELAIGDLGTGIPGSLRRRHAEIHDSACGYIQRALDGLSSRVGARGGVGLGAMRRITLASGGRLHVRSASGYISLQGNIDGSSVIHSREVAYMPGTQVAITFRSPVVPTHC